MPATLHEFARVNDAAAATTKKLQKQAILGEYFRSIEDDDDLRLAVRYCAGRDFPATDERVLNVGWSVVSDAVLTLLRIDPRVFYDAVGRTGDIGEGLSRVWPQAPSDPVDDEDELALREIARAFDELAVTGSTARKREIVHDLFARCRTGREAAYLAKIIFGDMRTGVQEGVLQAALAEAFGTALAQIARGQLLVGDLDEVAVMARNGTLGEARFRLFHPVQFMLATPQEDAEQAARTMAGRTFYCEDKLDGIRAQIHKSGDRVAIYTRTMDRTDESFPEVVSAIAKLPGEFLLDGEIVPWQGGCVLPFAHIQKRLGRKILTSKILRENPAAFIAFDILYKDGELLMDRPLSERRERLRQLVSESDVLTTQIRDVSSPEQIRDAFTASRDRRNEGIVLKDPASGYSPGRRGQMWLKLKTRLPTFDCVVTAAEFGHGKRCKVLSDYTFAVWDKDPDELDAGLVNVGKAYSGCTDEEIAQLTELFLKISVHQNGRVHIVPPQVVLEIACDQIQKSDRHASGYALRFPRIVRIRYDKRPQDADRLSRIIEIYESQQNFARWPGAPAETSEADASSPPSEPTLFDGLG